MSYYGTTALDAYTGALTGFGGSNRYDSLLDRKPYSATTYTSDYSFGGGSSRGSKNNESAYERYCRGDYLSELTGLKTSAYTTSYSPTTYVDDIISDVYSEKYKNYKNRSTTPIPSSSSSSLLSSRRKYVFEPDSTDTKTNKLGSSSSFYRTSGGYSNDNNISSSSYLNDNSGTAYSSIRSSSRIGAIGSAPAYDKFGKELSNYERWKLSQSGGYGLDDGYNNNLKGSKNSNETSYLNDNHTGIDNKTKSTDAYGSDITNRNGNQKENTRASLSRTRASKCDGIDGGSQYGTRLQKDREFSVIPTSSSSFLDWNDDKTPSITGSRFTGKSSVPASNSIATKQSLSNGVSRKSSPSSSAYLPTAANNSSSSYGTRSVHSFPSDVRSKLIGYDVRDVRGDGGCYYRCLSVYFTGSEDSYNTHRREVMSYIKEHQENYSSMIKSEIGYASTNDYFNRKTRSDRQEFAETTEIIATCCVYNINVHVLAVVPGGRRSWEWLHFDPSIGSGKPSTATRDIYLYNQGSVHFMLCSPK